MTPLDQALEAAKTSQCKRNAFYGLLVNTTLYIPTHESSSEDSFNPVLAEVDGVTYLMVFDSEEKLSAWAQKPMTYTTLAGHIVAEITQGNIHWALNMGSEHFKILVPDEVQWLKDLIIKFKAQAQSQVA
jgi:SseB protein N-terminal domain